MRFRVRHDIDLRSRTPVRNIAVVLRLVPRSHDGQHVADWRVDADLDCSLVAGQDAFGNATRGMSAPGPLARLTVSANGEVETFDTTGIVRGTAERLPVEMFLRGTGLTAAAPEVRDLAERSAGSETGALGRLHALLGALHERIAFAADGAMASPAETLRAARGDAPAHAHLFVTCARHLAIPSRFVGGYLARENGAGAAHAWAEAYVERLGWVGFDTVENLCPEGRHIRMAASLDALGTSFVRAAHFDVRTEAVTVTAT